MRRREIIKDIDYVGGLLSLAGLTLLQVLEAYLEEISLTRL